MANALFASGREGFLNGSIDWDTDTIKLILVDHTDDTPVIATDDNLDDILAGARVATSGALASKTVTGGVADAADVTLSTVTGDESESIVNFADSGVESTSRLISYIDTASGLPVTPNGGDITIAWANTGLDGAGGIFKL